MESVKTYDSFPFGMVLVTALFSLAIYAAGFYILLQAGMVLSLFYLAYVLFMEIRLLSRHCVNCYYYGKVCGFGKGWLSAMFFKKGDNAKFCEKPMLWKDLIPDLLVSLIPFVAGIILLVIRFNILLLAAVLLIALLSSQGNALVRGKIACKYCKQRELGCPAVELFNQK